MKMARNLEAAGIALLGMMLAVCCYAQDGGTAGTETTRLPNMPLHDPFIVADEETQTYYLYTSNIGRLSGTPGVGTMAYTSKDLLDWDPPKAVFIVPDDAFAKQGGWAPEVHKFKGRYYLFTTIHDNSQVLSTPPDSYMKQYV